MRFTPEQRQFAAEVTAFCDRECGTMAQREALTDGGTLANSPEILRRLGELGWLGISLPEEFGGGGGSFVDECIFLEAAWRGQAPITAYASSLTAAQTYLRWGTGEQKRAVTENICRGGLEAIALSEPGAGSDLSGVRLAAVRDGDHFVIDGQKTWTSAAHISAHVLVLTRTDTTLGKHRGLTLLMVPADADGLVMKEIRTMEAHTVNDLYFTAVRVPASSVVGTVDGAWHQLMRGLNVERMIIAAMSVGAAQRSLQDAIGYVKQREQFGRTISSFQAIRHRIADLATEIDHCRAYLYDVADRIDAGEEDELDRQASMAKLKSTEVAKAAALEGMQMMGGYGYAKEYGMEAQVRKALAPPIYGGTNEIQREIIGKSLGL